MSKTVDERVVSMQFDNKQFEKNVSTSMSTLEKLKQSLNLKDSAKGLTEVSNAAKRFDISPMSSGVETVKAKFSALEVMAVTTLANITNSAVNAGKKLVAAFTIDPIKSGFQEYETQINAVQTILANTSHNGTTLDQVNNALDTLNTYADKTIYNFTEMTRNIGTFTAAGLDLDTSVKGIQGIANLAAISGSTSQQASTAMYQLSQALSAGTVQLMDWNSVVNAGMGGKVFQDAIIQTGKEMGVLNQSLIDAYESGASFRSLLNAKDYGPWFTSDILSTTLGKFTKTGVVEYMAEFAGVSKESMQALQDLGDKTNYSSEEFDAMALSLANGDTALADNIKSTLKMASTAEDAATKVKTFSQLMDTLKEAVQSGWTQSWEILIGDFEEAKTLLTDVSNVFGEIINKSAEARNKVLQEWKDLGGRTDLIDSFWNIFNAIGNVIKPIKEAFREIFPPTTGKQLKEITGGFKELTAKVAEFTDKHGQQIHDTFKGIFSVVSIVTTALKAFAGGIVRLLSNFTGVTGGILDFTASLGNIVSGFSDSIKQSNIFGKAIDKIVDFLQKVIDKIKEVYKWLKNKIDMPGFQEFYDFLNGVWELIQNIGSKLQSFGTMMVGAFSKAFASGDLQKGMSLLNSGAFLGILLNIKKYIGGVADQFDDAKGIFEKLKGIVDKVSGVFDSVRESLETWQQNLKANILLKIAAAIGILAVALMILCTLDTGKLVVSMGVMTTAFADLVGSMMILDKFGGDNKRILKTATAMIAMSTAVLILSGALKVIASIETDKLAQSLVGITVLLGELTAVSIIMSKSGSKMVKGSVGLILMAAALKILASVCQDLGSMKADVMKQGLIGIGVLLTELTAVSVILSKSGSKMTKGSVGLILMAASLKILAGVCEDLGSIDSNKIIQGLLAMGAILLEIAAFSLLTSNSSGMISSAVGITIMAVALDMLSDVVSKLGGINPDAIIQGLLGMGAVLLEIAIAMKLMPKNMVFIGTGMLIVAGALTILSSVLSSFGGMSWEEIGKGLATLGGSLLILVVALNAMSGALSGAAALLVASVSLMALANVLQVLGGLSIGEIIKGIITLAVSLGVLIAAGYLATGAVPGLLGLGAAITLIGIGALAAGAGLLAFSAGLSALAVSGVAGMAALSAIILQIIAFIPTIIVAIGQGLLMLVEFIGNSASTIATAVVQVVSAILTTLTTLVPQFVEFVLTVVDALLSSLAEHAPSIIQSVVEIALGIVEGFLNGIAEKIPDVINAGFNLIISFINGLAQSVVDNAPLLRDAMINLGTSMMTAICEFFGIHSPSTKFADIGMNLIQGLINGIGNFAGGVISKIKTVAGNMLTSAGNKLKEFKNKGSDAMNKLKDGIWSKASTIKSKAKEIASNAVDGLKSKLSKFKDVGKNLIEGLKDGIKGAASKVIDSVKGVAQDAIDGAKALLGIHSPSRVFAEIGKFTDEGFVVGLNKYASKVGDASAEVGQKAIDGISGALSGIEDVANMDATPSIRPVLDMGSVNTRNLQLSANLSPLLTKPVDSLASLMTTAQNEINASNNRVISAINGLRDDFAEFADMDDSEIGLYVDGKKLASTLAKPMNRQLSILSKRGGI